MTPAGGAGQPRALARDRTFLAQHWARQVKARKKLEDLDLFGPVSVAAGGGVSNAGRPRLPTRVMVALLYLNHAFNESDEDV